jgi:hypothetical protein
VDIKNGFIYLEATDTKDKEKHSIPISGGLRATLQSIPRAVHDPHVFLYKAKPIADIRTGLKMACKEAGVQESVIMKITGYSTRSMFDRYNTIDEGDLRKAIEHMRRYFTQRVTKVMTKAKNKKIRG